MNHNHGAVAQNEKQEQALRHVKPAADQQCDIDRVDGGHAERVPDIADAEDEGVAECAPERVFET